MQVSIKNIVLSDTLDRYQVVPIPGTDRVPVCSPADNTAKSMA